MPLNQSFIDFPLPLRRKKAIYISDSFDIVPEGLQWICWNGKLKVSIAKVSPGFEFVGLLMEGT